MKNYELITKLSELPAGAEIVCSGVETVDSLTNNEACGENEIGSKEYSMTKTIVDVDLEGKRIYLQW